MNKIFFITNELCGGGAERVMSVLANFFCSKNYDVNILVLKESCDEYPLDEKIKIFTWKDRKDRDAFGQIKFIRKYMKQNANSVFVSFLSHQNLYTIIASIGLNVKVLVSERNDPKHSIKGKAMKLIRAFLYGSCFCDKIVFQTVGASNYYPNRIQKKGIVIPNPLKCGLPNRFEGKREKLVVSFGRFEPQKNYKLLIEAFSKFHKSHNDYSLVLYGKGTEQEILEEFVKQLNLEESVHFAGFDKNVHEKIINASMFVLPSDYEGLSNSMLEALAIGLPTVCTDCPPGGARLFIENNKNGILVPVRDADSMCNAMSKIADDEEFSYKLSKNAILVREQLKAQNICEIWVKNLLSLFN